MTRTRTTSWSWPPGWSVVTAVKSSRTAMGSPVSAVEAWWREEPTPVTGREDWGAGAKSKWAEMINTSMPTQTKLFHGKQPAKRNNQRQHVNVMAVVDQACSVWFKGNPSIIALLISNKSSIVMLSSWCDWWEVLTLLWGLSPGPGVALSLVALVWTCNRTLYGTVQVTLVLELIVITDTPILFLISVTASPSAL